MKNILNTVKPNDIEDELMNLIGRLGVSDFLSQKLSLINIVPFVYKSFQAKNKEILLK
jgi:hypothetical protein